MSDSSPVLPNNDNNKMTKSYLLESDPFLKTSSKTSPFALNAAEDAGTGAGDDSESGGGGSGHRHHHHCRPATNHWNHFHDDAAAAAAAAAAIQQQFRQQHLQLQQHSIPGHDLFSDRPSVKPSLAMHGHVQPIAYINGNSVRPVRCRHYSQQQTALSVMYQQQQQQQQQQAMQHNNSRNMNVGGVGGGRGIDSMSESTSSTSSSSSGSIGSDSHEDMIMDHDGLSSSGSASDVGPVLYGAGNAVSGTGGGNGTGSQRRVQFADGGQMHSSTNSSSTASSTSYSTTSHSTSSNYSSSFSSQQQSSANQPRSKSSWFSLFSSFSFSSSTSSPSSASSSSSFSQRDSVTNDENEFNVQSLCSDQPEQVIEYLAKVIAAQLRDARENRRLVCRELFLPNDLLKNIAAKVRTLAETEPCGLRGCKFYICIEDKDASSSSLGTSTALNSGAAGSGGTTTTQSMTSSDLHLHQQQLSNSQLAVNSRLLGEVSLDRTMVPTFEVFLTLKPTLPNWFDALESRLFGRERIILAENYLLHKKKLYQNTSPTSTM